MDLRSTQLKDTYGNLLTIGTSAGSPTTGTIENGDGQDITALDVNGSITTNGLTIDQTSNVVLDLNTTNSNGDITLNNVSYGVRLRTNNAGGFSIMPSDTTFLNVALNGDVNFYDSTGTNPDFYWDASEARLGLGTNSPSTKLHLGGTAPLDSIIRQDSTVSGTNWEIGEREAGKWQIFEDDGDSIVATFASSGRLGLGTTSPQNLLHINKSDSLASAMQFTNSTTGATSSDGVFIGLGSGEQGYFWNYEANDLILGTSNAERMRIDSIGNVGIGTNPNAFSNQTSLTVRGTSVSRIDLQGAGGSGGGVFLATATETQLGGNFNIPLKLFTSSTAGITFETNSNPRMTIDSSGNVGIGTTNPSALLSGGNVAVDVSSSNGGEFVARRSGGQANLAMGVTSGDIGYLYSTTATPMVFGTNNSEAMRIDASGNVGIGITNPSDYFTSFNDLVVGSTSARSGITIVSSTSNDGTLAFADGTTGDQAYRGYIQYSHGTDNLSVGTAGGEAIRIDSSGNLGINYNNGVIHTYGSGVFGGKTVIKASSDNALALLNSTTGGSAQVALNFTNEFVANQYNYLARIVAKPAQAWSSDAATRDSDLIFSTTLNGVTAERMRILSGGDVSFAMQDFSASPSNTVYGLRLITGAAGKSYWKSAVNADTTHYHYEFLNTNGSVGNISTSASATAYNTSSDYRLKENVVEMTGALDRVDQLKPSRFNFIADADRTVDGFLAHEVADVVPEAITGEKDAVDDEGNPIYQSIDQSKLVPLLVGAIQELKAEIEQLKNQ